MYCVTDKVEKQKNPMSYLFFFPTLNIIWAKSLLFSYVLSYAREDIFNWILMVLTAVVMRKNLLLQISIYTCIFIYAIKDGIS